MDQTIGKRTTHTVSGVQFVALRLSIDNVLQSSRRTSKPPATCASSPSHSSRPGLLIRTRTWRTVECSRRILETSGASGGGSSGHARSSTERSETTVGGIRRTLRTRAESYAQPELARMELSSVRSWTIAYGERQSSQTATMTGGFIDLRFLPTADGGRVGAGATRTDGAGEFCGLLASERGTKARCAIQEKSRRVRSESKAFLIWSSSPWPRRPHRRDPPSRSRGLAASSQSSSSLQSTRAADMLGSVGCADYDLGSFTSVACTPPTISTRSRSTASPCWSLKTLYLSVTSTRAYLRVSTPLF